MRLEMREGRGRLATFRISAGDRSTTFVADDDGLRTSAEWLEQTGGGAPLPGTGEDGDVPIRGLPGPPPEAGPPR